jgi:hypothetical protein
LAQEQSIELLKTFFKKLSASCVFEYLKQRIFFWTWALSLAGTVDHKIVGPFPIGLDPAGVEGTIAYSVLLHI